MNINEFNLLTSNNKEDLIWKEGKLYISFDEGNQMCDIYELFDFFVCFRFEFNKNAMAQITAACSTDALIQTPEFILD